MILSKKNTSKSGGIDLTRDNVQMINNQMYLYPKNDSFLADYHLVEDENAQRITELESELSELNALGIPNRLQTIITKSEQIQGSVITELHTQAASIKETSKGVLSQITAMENELETLKTQ